MIDWLVLLMFIALCEVVGAVSSVFTIKAIPYWYKNLKKPKFNPPGWVFGPAWTLLYGLMGLSLYLAFENAPNQAGILPGVIAFTLQLALNYFWTYIFFGRKNIKAALYEIIFLWIAIAATIIFFFPISPLAAYLLLPYIAWVSFAALLNQKIYELNITKEKKNSKKKSKKKAEKSK